ncbi:MAG: hypothetical protein IJE85_06540 [Bacteroidales bacterium]|nr:hypothetical protein [Bacteroidales bacterium]
MLSSSGPVLGILLAVADYRVAWTCALSLMLAVVLLAVYMIFQKRFLLVPAAASVVLTAYASYGTVLSLETLILMLFTYFLLRLSKGAGNSGRIMDGVVTCLLKGPVAVYGAYFVCTHSFPFWFILFPSLSVGLLCVAADGVADNCGKVLTSLLIYVGLAMMVTYSCLRIFELVHFLFLITIPAFIFITVRMYMNKEHNSDTYRPALALCIFVLTLLTGVGFIGYLF